MTKGKSLETESFPGELRVLRNIFTRLIAYKTQGYFLCGEGGSKDVNGMPESIFVCPTSGLDWFQIYQRTNRTVGPEY